jgi:Domain of unknown function (DUF397)
MDKKGTSESRELRGGRSFPCGNAPGAPDMSGARWRKSSHSLANGNCVEVALLKGAAAVRDSKDRDGAVLVVTPPQWKAFVGEIRGGRFDSR